MAEIFDLDTTAANNTARFPENMQFRNVNDSARELEAMLARQHKDTNMSLSSSGSSNAFAVTSNRTITSYLDNLEIGFTANHTITGAATLNLNGLGAKAIVSNHDSALTSGDIVSGQRLRVVYRASQGNFQLVGPARSSTADVPTTRTLTAAGLVTGGGDLSANRTFTVTEASQAEAQAATASTVVLTPRRGKDLVDERLADQSEMEAASSSTQIATPGLMHHHPGIAKFWGFATVTAGVPTLQASYNVTSITDSGVGNLTVTIGTDFSDANWACLAMTKGENASLIHLAGEYGAGTKTAGSVQLDSRRTDNVSADPQSWSFAGFGDQA